MEIGEERPLAPAVASPIATVSRLTLNSPPSASHAAKLRPGSVPSESRNRAPLRSASIAIRRQFIPLLRLEEGEAGGIEREPVVIAGSGRRRDHGAVGAGMGERHAVLAGPRHDLDHESKRRAIDAAEACVDGGDRVSPGRDGET